MPHRNANNPLSILRQAEAAQEKVHRSDILSEDEEKALAFAVNVYRGVTGIRAFGKWLAVFAAGLAAVMVLVEKVLGYLK